VARRGGQGAGRFVGSTELKKISRQEERRRRATQQHPLASGFAVFRDAGRLVQVGERQLREKKRRSRQAKLGVAGVKEEVASLTDAVEILRWYQHQIHLKLCAAWTVTRRAKRPRLSQGLGWFGESRAPRHGPIHRRWMRMNDFFRPKPTVFSACWFIWTGCAGHGKGIPNARRFVRPGFDTETAASYL